MDHLSEILSRTEIDEKQLVAVYPYGSRVYGTARKNSDYDYIVVAKEIPSLQFSDKLININFYTVDEHQWRLYDHEISALECYFLPKDQVILEKRQFEFKLDLGKLRTSLSSKVSNSFVKAKKKLTVEKDYDLNLGRKSLFHSFRILYYGIQIAETGRIHDYGQCNALFKEIMNHYTWGELFSTYKAQHNALCTEFRKVAPID